VRFCVFLFFIHPIENYLFTLKIYNMKRVMMLFTALVVFSSVTFAQKDAEGAFPKGSLAFNLGIGLGDVYYGDGYGTSLPVSPTFSVDYAITNKIGIGNIAVGGFVSYTSSKYNDGYGDNYDYSAVLVGLRGTYHFILPIDKLDPYAGVSIGYVIASNGNTDIYANNVTGPDGKASAVEPGLFVGAHYLFVPHFGVFAELGYNGFSILTLGISLKF
jgi:hypothetical protein